MRPLITPAWTPIAILGAPSEHSVGAASAFFAGQPNAGGPEWASSVLFVLMGWTAASLADGAAIQAGPKWHDLPEQENPRAEVG